MSVFYLFLLNRNRVLDELPVEIREKTDYHVRRLTDEHVTKLILLQKMENSVQRSSVIFLCWDTDAELDDYGEELHPKLFSILKYTADTYRIFHKKIEDLTDTDIKLIKEQKNYNNK